MVLAAGLHLAQRLRIGHWIAGQGEDFAADVIEVS